MATEPKKRKIWTAIMNMDLLWLEIQEFKSPNVLYVVTCYQENQ